MSASIKKISRDETRLGDQAANQPLSGTSVVQGGRVKGYANMGFIRGEETSKKAC